MEDEDIEFNEMEEFAYQEKIKKTRSMHQIDGFLLLFKHWNKYGDNAAKRIYLYFNDNHTLQKMLKVFESIEEYEKCAVIQHWLNEIQKLEKIDSTNI